MLNFCYLFDFGFWKMKTKEISIEVRVVGFIGNSIFLKDIQHMMKALFCLLIVENSWSSLEISSTYNIVNFRQQQWRLAHKSKYLESAVVSSRWVELCQLSQDSFYQSFQYDFLICFKLLLRLASSSFGHMLIKIWYRRSIRDLASIYGRPVWLQSRALTALLFICQYHSWHDFI